MTFGLSSQSRAKMNGVHPDLVRVVERAITLTTVDFSVLEGVRTLKRQQELYAQGRTKPGPKVTWTMNSKHRAQVDGFGHAVDLVPYPLDWNATSKFAAISKAMMAAAKDVGVKVRWGGNWDGDDRPGEKGEFDGPHFEIVVA
jgi:peptidoglycan LD-endopeptidase CwlK